jgi:uncharacterized protein
MKPLADQAAPLPALDDGAGERPLPWYGVGMMWLVIGGPAAVVVAGIVTMVIAWTHVDPLVNDASAAGQQVTAQPQQPTAPALDARNHAATPTR